MKKKNKKIIIKYILILAVPLLLLLICLLSLKSLADSKGSDIVDETETAEQSELEFPDEADYLFVGNSLTHFNNIPLMFQNMVQEGQHYMPSTVLCAYSGRSLELHSKAIEAVVASRGDEAYLEEHPSLKDYFWKVRGKAYDPSVFQGYCKRLLKEDGTPKHFSNIVLQISYKDGQGDAKASTIEKSIVRIMNAMQSEDTSYTVVATMGQWHDDLKQFVTDQNVIDKIVEKAAVSADDRSTYHRGDIKISYYGRSLCNYLLMCGSEYAQLTEPDAYQVYMKNTKPDMISNDVLIGDGIHPTQLGSYIATAALYTLMYNSRPQATIKGFRGESSYAIRVDDERLTGKCCRASQYNNRKGFENDAILLAGTEAAFRTQKNKLKLFPTSTSTKGLTYIGDLYKEPERLSAKNVSTKNVSAKNVSNGIKVTWSTSGQKDAAGSDKLPCKVYRKKGKDGKWTEIGQTTGNSFTDETAKEGTTYFYTVRIFNMDLSYPASPYDTTGIKGEL